MQGFAAALGPTERHFLGVARSLTGRRLARAARSARRGGRDGHGAARYCVGGPGARACRPRASGSTRRRPICRRRCARTCADPSSLTDMDAAAARLADAVARRRAASRSSATTTWTAPPPQRCCTACSRRSGTAARIYIPDRIFEGYGPNPEAIDRLIDGGATLIVCVDCGSTSFEALERAQRARRRRDRARPPPGRRGAAAGGGGRQSEPPRRHLRRRGIWPPSG